MSSHAGWRPPKDLRAIAALDNDSFVEFFPVLEPEHRELVPGGYARYRALAGVDLQALEPNCAAAYANFATLDSDPPPARSWALESWFPMGAVGTLFSGPGFGKTLLMQQFATHFSLGVDFIGAKTLGGAVLGWFCEDDNDELRRRAIPIERSLGRPIGSAPMYLSGRAGRNSLLVAFDRDRRVLRTPAYGQLVGEIERIGPSLLILDNVAHLFGGMENDRGEVTLFVNELTALARKYGLAVVLVGHVAKDEGSQYSGSTAWDAAVRARAWLERRADDTLTLHRRKANYATRDSVELEWADGCFRLLQRGEAAATRIAMDVVLAGLDAMTHRQCATSHSASSPKTYLPRMLEREGLLAGVPYQAACRALSALLDSGAVVPNAPLAWKKADRHPAIGLRRADQAALL